MNPLPTQQRRVGDLVCSSFTVKRVELDSAIKMPNRASVNLIFVWVFVRLQVKYVGDDGEEQNGLQMTGLNLMDKTMAVRGARIAYSIWDVAGDIQSVDHIPIACKDAMAILYMFDLTSRCTLNNILDWYERARRWNKTAIPILIGTKFDDFAQLPLEMQWAIVNQARAYARAMKATLFFSSATHNINVNKIFKFITAKLFNLPWTVERNLTIGEPIIDF